MLTRITLLVFIVLTCMSVTAAAVDDKQVLSAVESGLDDPNNFKVVHEFIVGNSQKWRDIPWYSDLWQARLESRKQNKPLFIWAMNGDPLGCV